MSRLKQLVNDKPLYDAFLEYIDEEIEISRKNLEQAEAHNFKYYQGQIATLRKLQKLRERVNG